MKESIFKKLKKKKRSDLTAMPGVYDELPPPRKADDTYLRPEPKNAGATGPGADEAGTDYNTRYYFKMCPTR